MDLFDGLTLAGTIILTVGVWMFSPAIALIVLGALLIVGGLVGAVLKSGTTPFAQRGQNEQR